MKHTLYVDSDERSYECLRHIQDKGIPNVLIVVSRSWHGQYNLESLRSQHGDIHLPALQLTTGELLVAGDVIKYFEKYDRRSEDSGS
jgi:hypothetical protein